MVVVHEVERSFLWMIDEKVFLFFTNKIILKYSAVFFIVCLVMKKI